MFSDFNGKTAVTIYEKGQILAHFPQPFQSYYGVTEQNILKIVVSTKVFNFDRLVIVSYR